jgi:hypothetical protein
LKIPQFGPYLARGRQFTNILSGNFRAAAVCTGITASGGIQLNFVARPDGLDESANAPKNYIYSYQEDSSLS